jgi:hypothetical protein
LLPLRDATIGELAFAGCGGVFVALIGVDPVMVGNCARFAADFIKSCVFAVGETRDGAGAPTETEDGAGTIVLIPGLVGT